MNREALEVQLRDEGVPETWYHLHGAHYPERDVLDHRAAGWVVFYTERGDESAVTWFDGEADACEELLTRLRSELRRDSAV
jgi:hypothetical protein